MDCHGVGYYPLFPKFKVQSGVTYCLVSPATRQAQMWWAPFTWEMGVMWDKRENKQLSSLIRFLLLHESLMGLSSQKSTLLQEQAWACFILESDAKLDYLMPFYWIADPIPTGWQQASLAWIQFVLSCGLACITLRHCSFASTCNRQITFPMSMTWSQFFNCISLHLKHTAHILPLSTVLQVCFFAVDRNIIISKLLLNILNVTSVHCFSMLSNVSHKKKKKTKRVSHC